MGLLLLRQALAMHFEGGWSDLCDCYCRCAVGGSVDDLGADAAFQAHCGDDDEESCGQEGEVNTRNVASHEEDNHHRYHTRHCQRLDPDHRTNQNQTDRHNCTDRDGTDHVDHPCMNPNRSNFDHADCHTYYRSDNRHFLVRMEDGESGGYCCDAADRHFCCVVGIHDAGEFFAAKSK